MKIIKQGFLPEELLYDAECNYCHTVVEFKRGEAKVESHKNETYLFVECPLCKRTIGVKA